MHTLAKYKIFALGDSALTIEFGNEVSPDLNSKALDLAEYFRENSFEGLIEAVPAYASTTLFYDPAVVKSSFDSSESVFEAVRELVENAALNTKGIAKRTSRIVQIPIVVDSESALDTDFFSEFSGLANDEVISIFLQRTYQVYMLGFLPGFAYMGEVDARIAAPRKQTPRLRVPKGSVGIAGKQTGIYPLESPGGWQIIGRTEMEMFDPSSKVPCPLRPGDDVKFVRA